jgi:hypothetical protein
MHMIVIYTIDGQTHLLRVPTSNANFAGDAVRELYPTARITAILGTRIR